MNAEVVIRLESKINTPKEFLGYIAMIIADGYLSTADTVKSFVKF